MYAASTVFSSLSHSHEVRARTKHQKKTGKDIPCSPYVMQEVAS